MRTLVLLLAVLPLHSQTTIDTFAGGVVRTGVPAQEVLPGSIAGTARDSTGNLVFCDPDRNGRTSSGVHITP